MSPRHLPNGLITMKKFLALCGSALASAVTFAADSAIVDTATIDTAMTQIKTDLTTWVTAALPIVLGIAGAFMVFWLGKIVIRVIKSFGNSAK